MEIIIYDSYENELNLGDIILLRHPNKDIIYLGVLEFVTGKENTFRLTDMKEGWEQFYSSTVTQVIKIGDIEMLPDLIPHLGYYVKRKSTKLILNMIGQDYDPTK